MLIFNLNHGGSKDKEKMSKTAVIRYLVILTRESQKTSMIEKQILKNQQILYPMIGLNRSFKSLKCCWFVKFFMLLSRKIGLQIGSQKLFSVVQ